MRVAVLTNMVAPYKTPLFSLLHERLDGDFVAIYETEMEANRAWAVGQLPYRHVVLPSLSIDLRRVVADMYLHIPWRPLAPLVRFRPDVVIAGGGAWTSPTNVAAALAKRRYGWKFVPWWGSFARRERGLVHRLSDPAARAFVSAGDAWIATGSRARRELERLGANPAQITLAREIPGEIDGVELLSERQARQYPRIRYLFVGQLIDRKGIRQLLGAFERLMEADLTIVGEGELRPVVEAAAARDPRIRYLGHLGGDELRELYGELDVLVLPSLYEVWGLVVTEALMRGMPVIVSDAVGAAEEFVLNGKTGLVFPAGDESGLARAMEAIRGWFPSQLAECATLSESRIQAWSVERTADRILAAAVAAASGVR